MNAPIKPPADPPSPEPTLPEIAETQTFGLICENFGVVSILGEIGVRQGEIRDLDALVHTSRRLVDCIRQLQLLIGDLTAAPRPPGRAAKTWTTTEEGGGA